MCLIRVFLRLSAPLRRWLARHRLSTNYEVLLDTGEDELKPGVDYVNIGDEDQMELHGYRNDLSKQILAWILTIITLGIARLFFYWNPIMYLRFTHSPCTSDVATKFLLTQHFQQSHTEYFIADVQRLCLGEGREWRIFVCNGARYVCLPTSNSFQKLKGLEEGAYCAFLHQQKILTSEEHEFRQWLYGDNMIQVELPSYGQQFLFELLEPFAWFQLFALVLWTIEGYVYYSVIVFGMTAFNMLASAWQTRANRKQFKKKWETDSLVSVRTFNGADKNVNSKYLVPGDMVVVQEGHVPCDMAILSGSCVVQEQLMAGSENPVSVYKTALPNRCDVLFDAKEHASNVLLGGTAVTKVQDKTVGIILRTGYMTAQGQVAAAVLFPKPLKSYLDKDAIIVVWLLAFISLLAILYTIVKHALEGEGFGSLALKALDLVTICVPPALPAIISLGVFHAAKRLKKYGITCSDPQAINLVGAVDCLVFDKTGTLTEAELDFHTAAYMEMDNFSTDWRVHTELLLGMATCNDLLVLPGGKVSGDPLDMLVFEATGWKMTHFRNSGQISVCPTSNPADTYHRVVRRYPFSAALQRTGVLVFSQGTEPVQTNATLKLKFFCKGSCETVLPVTKFSDAEAAKIWQEEAEHYARRGYRVLLLAGTTIEITSSQVEKYASCGRNVWESKGLEPLGLLILKNRIKKSALSVIQSLKTAQVRVVLATGDDMWTALHVAKQCGIIKRGQPLTLVEAEAPPDGQPSLVFKNLNTETDEMSVRSETRPTPLEESSGDIFSSSTQPSAASNAQPYLLVTGNTWHILQKHFRQILFQVALRGLIFARMRPQQKKALVGELQNLGYVVGMCGNANSDMRALKAAHVGLTVANLDVQTTAFTVRSRRLDSVVRLLREGRAALVSSLGLFKFMTAYSLAQFTTVMMLYELETNLSDWQFLYIDLVIVTFIVFAFVRTRAYEATLASAPCLQSLLLVDAVISVTLQMIFVICGQYLAYSLAQDQTWLWPANSSVTSGDMNPTESVHSAALTNYAVWSVSVFQYLTLAITFSQGPPFRQPWYTNAAFVLIWVTLVVLSAYLMIFPHAVLVVWLGFEVPPNFEFRFALLTLAFVCGMVSLAIERFFAQGILRQAARNLLRFFRPSIKTRDFSATSKPEGLFQSPNVITCTNQTKCPPPAMLHLQEHLRNNAATLSPGPCIRRDMRVSVRPTSPCSNGASIVVRKLRRLLGFEEAPQVAKYQLVVESTKVKPPSFVNEVILSPATYNSFPRDSSYWPYHSRLYRSQTSRRK